MSTAVKHRNRWAWPLALGGQFVLVVALLALSGPGRIDDLDGQTRYEVARSLVDHGDVVVRCDHFWWCILPGRDGRQYSSYRLPHSLLGVPAILAADATGPKTEGRRHFFFCLVSAVMAGVLAVTYSVWFRSLGYSVGSALLWGLAGIVCTPNWYYGTSTFDDILGATAVVFALTVARTGRSRPYLAAIVAGLAIAWAFHCKQPLGIFVLCVLAAICQPGLPLRSQFGRWLVVLACLLLGLAAYVAYEHYKFPPQTRAGHEELTKRYAPHWPANPLMSLACLAFSPAASVFLYCPPVVLGLYGLWVWRRTDRWLVAATVTATIVFTGFIACLTIFKGDWAWGPRYLTPVCAVLWLFVPAGAACLPLPTTRRLVVGVLLTLGIVVQVLGLSVLPHRLYMQRNLPSSFGVSNPELYFDPAVSHLFNRPREIREILTAPRSAEAFTPARAPTFTIPLVDEFKKPREMVARYHVYNSLRPWWISQRYLAPHERPVDLWRTFGLLCGLVVLGAAVLATGWRAAATGKGPPSEEGRGHHVGTVSVDRGDA